MPKENIHDKLFKETLSIPSEAKALVKLFLPKWISSNLDYRSFKLAPNSFVNEQLSEYLTDMVYQVRWKGKSELLISFLLEHKSYPDPKIAYQLLRYLTEAYDQQFKEKDQSLSIIIPIVIYHGEQQWKKRSFHDFFNLPNEQLKQYLPFFDYELLDLSHISDERLFNLQIGYYLKSTFLVFKHKNDKDFIEQFAQEIFIFVEHELSEQLKVAFTKALLLYIFKAFQFSKQDFQSFTKKLPKMTGIVSGSLYEQLIQEGMEKGMQKGIEQGMQKGEYKKSILAIRNMTLEQFPVSTIAKVLSVTEKYIGQIQKDLQKESAINSLLAKKQTSTKIAEELKVSEWLVEVIRDLK